VGNTFNPLRPGIGADISEHRPRHREHFLFPCYRTSGSADSHLPRHRILYRLLREPLQKIAEMNQGRGQTHFWGQAPKVVWHQKSTVF